MKFCEHDQPIFQAAFEKSILGIRAQGGPAWDSSLDDMGGCKYRLVMPDETIRKCGVGQLIEDRYYNASFESVTAVRIAEPAHILIDIKEGGRALFLESLQDCHDSCTKGGIFSDSEFLADFEIACQHMAYHLGLRYPQPVVAGGQDVIPS